MKQRISGFFIFLIILLFSCNSNVSKETKNIDSALSQDENMQETDTVIYFKDSIKCTGDLVDNVCKKRNLESIKFKHLQNKKPKLNNLTVKEIIELSRNIESKYLEKKKNEFTYNNFLDVSSVDFFSDKFERDKEIDVCNFSRIYFNNNNDIGYLKLMSNKLEYPNLTLFPFFFKEYTYCFCSKVNYSFYDRSAKKITKGYQEEADDNFVFIDKTNKIRLCFGLENSKVGRINSDPILWPRLYILDENLYPIYYIRFRFDDRAKGAIGIENLYKLIYLKNTKYVKKYQELDFISLNKTIIYSDSTKYLDLVAFVNLLLGKGANLPNKKTSDEDYPISYDTRFFPPVPEWAK